MTGRRGDQGTTHGPATEKSFFFRTRGAGLGTFYAGGYYIFGGTDNDFNPVINWGSVDSAYGAHVFIVNALHPGGGDTTIQVAGTSMDDQGNRTAADTEDLTVASGQAADGYAETVKKWIGRVTITKTAGPDVLCNYGFCKYWDNNNNDFVIRGLEATWLAGANDAAFNILLRHHRATGWTYVNAAPPTPPAALNDMNTDYNTEMDLVNGEPGAWKRDDLDQYVQGGDIEGTIIEIVAGQNNAIEWGNFILRIQSR